MEICKPWDVGKNVYNEIIFKLKHRLELTGNTLSQSISHTNKKYSYSLRKQISMASQTMQIIIFHNAKLIYLYNSDLNSNSSTWHSFVLFEIQQA